MLSKYLNVNLLCYCYYKNNKPSYLKSRRYVLKCRNYLLDNLVRIVYNYVYFISFGYDAVPLAVWGFVSIISLISSLWVISKTPFE